MIRLITDVDGTKYKFTLNANHRIIRVYKMNPNTNKYSKFKIYEKVSKLDMKNFAWFVSIGMINWLLLDYYGNFKIWR